MSEEANTAENLPELRRQDLLVEPDDLARVVAMHGHNSGVGLLEAFLRCYFEADAVEASLHFYTKAVWAAEAVDENTALLIWGKVIRLMTEAAGEPLEAVLRVALAQGMVTVRGRLPGQESRTEIDLATALRARVNVWAEYITDYRDGHQTRLGGILLAPTTRALDLFRKPFKEPAAFTAALDELACFNEVPGQRGEKPTRHIRETKAEIHRYLSECHGNRFGTLDTFSRNYTNNGPKAVDLPYRIVWVNNKNRQS